MLIPKHCMEARIETHPCPLLSGGRFEVPSKNMLKELEHKLFVCNYYRDYGD